MKRVIRRGVWETNSSTSHSVIIMTEDKYKKWEEGNLYYYGNTRSWYDPFKELPEEKKPRNGELYTQDEVIEFYRLQGYEFDPEAGDYDTVEENKDQYISEMGDFVGYHSFAENEYLETDTNYYTTPGGEKIVVTCQYGSDY